MSDPLRILPCGLNGVLIEAPDLATVSRLSEALRRAQVEGLHSMVPAARTLYISCDHALDIAKVLATLDLGAVAAQQARREITIPMVYDGPDLDDVAAYLGWSQAELVARHIAATFTAAFNGFAPGFCYLTCDEPAFDIPRRAVPRPKIAAGSVGLAGRFGGIYPTDSPGGWQILGRTGMKLWDITRDEPALIQPGDSVRFVPVDALPKAAETTEPPKPETGLKVVGIGLGASFQDRGRAHMAAQGLAPSGAIDRIAMVEANLRLGNPSDAPVVEIAYGGLSLLADAAEVLCLTGADCGATLTAADGNTVNLHWGHPFAVDAGDRVTLGVPQAGVYSILSRRGGFAPAAVLGSHARDSLAQFGPAPLRMGDHLPAGQMQIGAVQTGPFTQDSMPKSGEIVTLRILAGPRWDWFTKDAQQLLTKQEWSATAEASRTGIRLAGQSPLTREIVQELPSEATIAGAIQVPPAGQPIVFLKDHPVTGGYPVIGIVHPDDLATLGQCPAGVRLRFELCATFNPMTLHALDSAKMST